MGRGTVLQKSVVQDAVSAVVDHVESDSLITTPLSTFRILKAGSWQSLSEIEQIHSNYCNDHRSRLSSGETIDYDTYYSDHDFENTGIAPPVLGWNQPGMTALHVDMIKESLGGASLKDAEILLLGIGAESWLVSNLIKAYPDLKAIHILDVSEDLLRELDRRLAQTLITDGTPIPNIYAHRGSVLEIPAAISSGKISLVYDCGLFDTTSVKSFDSISLYRAQREICRVLKPNGIHISYDCFAITEYPDDIRMTTTDRLNREYKHGTAPSINIEAFVHRKE